MSDQFIAVTDFNVSPGFEADAVALMSASIALIQERFPNPRDAAGHCCLASFADLPSGTSYIVEISVRIDPTDGQPLYRTESVADFKSAAEMRAAFRNLAARQHLA
jgi:hypothetical protein